VIFVVRIKILHLFSIGNTVTIVPKINVKFVTNIIMCDICRKNGTALKKVNVFPNAKSTEEIIREIIADRRPRNNNCIPS
jgi:hypothetical protein